VTRRERDRPASAKRSIVWFRGKDLRIADHAPLRDAIRDGEVIPLFVLDPHFFDPERARELPHRMQFLLDSLHELAGAIARRSSRLVVVAGRSVEVVPALVRAWRADRVLAHRWTEPVGRARDRRIAAALGDDRFVLYEGETLRPPGTLRSGAGKPYTVFTPFARAFDAGAIAGDAIAAPRRIPPLPADVRAGEVAIPTCADLGIARNDRVIRGGETAARARLRRFRDRLAAYPTARDRMDLDGTSRLSVDLKFGTIAVHRVWAAATGRGAAKFRSELLWRELAYSTLWDRPDVLERPFRDDFVGFPWIDDTAGWRAWIDGTTGYPIVDAAARQLLAEGYVHNRARMVAASFLTKHLVIDYRRGEAHYLKYLVDGDWANNNLGWQWSAGCGCDAQPYFRIFHPVLQGERFDPTGAYVRRWLPDLRDVPLRFVHQPWNAPTPPRSYPPPIIDHRVARDRYLAIAKSHLRRQR
jgi:deoxyribodipyrimidine photo-lyase